MRTLEQLYREIEVGSADFIDILVKGPNTTGLFSNQPLHIAAIWGDCEAIQLLVDAGANIDAVGEHGFTPLHEAANQGHLDAVKLLVSLGASSIRCDEDQLPSGWTGDKDTAKYLAENGF